MSYNTRVNEIPQVNPDGKMLSRRVFNRRALAALIGLTVAPSVLLEACTGLNTKAAYPDLSQAISPAEYETGIDTLQTPADRSMVLIEAVQGGKVQFDGHGVLTYGQDGSVQLLTAYHVIQKPKDELGTVHWQIRVGGVGTVRLPNIAFQPKPDSGVDPENYAYGLMQADLTPFLSGDFQNALQEGTVLPCVVSSSPNHDVTSGNRAVGMILADGNSSHTGTLTIIDTPAWGDGSGLYQCTIIQGGFCMGMSGAPIYRVHQEGQDYRLATDEQGRYILEGVATTFLPDTTVPGDESFYECTNGNVTIALTNLSK